MSTRTVHRPQSREELLRLVKDPSVSLGDIDTSGITDMHELFSNSDREDFRGIENWDTSRVQDMSGMFQGAKAFNAPLDNWDVSSVTDMSRMFQGAKVFNQTWSIGMSPQ